MPNTATKANAISYQSALRVAPLDLAIDAIERAERLRSRHTFDGAAQVNRKLYGAMASSRFRIEEPLRESQTIALECYCRYVSPSEIGLLLPPYLEPCEEVEQHPILTAVSVLKSGMEWHVGLRFVQGTLWISGRIVRMSLARYGYLEVGVKCQRRYEESCG